MPQMNPQLKETWIPHLDQEPPKRGRAGDDLHPLSASLFPDHRPGQWRQMSLKSKL